MSRLAFRPHWAPALAALVVMALTVRLGFWQLDRAQQKRQQGERYARLASEPAVTLPASFADPSPFLFRRVVATGTYLGEHMVYVDNRTYRGVAGYHVVTPLRVEFTGAVLLVNRGWVAAGRDRTVLPAVTTPAGRVEVSGLAVLPGRTLELSRDTVQGRLWQNLDLERYRQIEKLDVLPLVLQQEGGPEDGLVREWELPAAGAEKNMAYAVQWFLLAAIAAGLFFWFSLKRVPE